MKSSVKIYNTWQLDTKVWYIGWNEIPIRIYHNENLYESGNYVSITLNASTGWTVSSLTIVPPSSLWYISWSITVQKWTNQIWFQDSYTGTSCTCTATADSWYQFYKWEINWEEMAGGGLSYSITQDTTINAVFVEEVTISLLANDWWKFMDTSANTINSITVPNTKLKFIGTWYYPQYDWSIEYWDGSQWQAIALYKCADYYQILTWIDNMWQTYEFPEWNGHTVIFPDAWSVAPVGWLYNSSFSIDHPSGTLNLLCEDETWDPYLNAYWTLDDAWYTVVNSINVPSSSLYVVVTNISSSPYQFAIMFKDNLNPTDYWYANIRADTLNHSLNRIEYRRANGTVVWTFDLTTIGDALPLTWWIQSGDKVVMVINSTPPGPSTFTYENLWTTQNYSSRLSNMYWSLPWYMSTSTQVRYALRGDDWYYYACLGYSENWGSPYYMECIKIEITGSAYQIVANWQVRLTDSGGVAWSAIPGVFYNGNNNYFSYFTDYVDSSIVDYQTLWEYIYNHLQ